MCEVVPALFVAHGSPMVAIEDSSYGRFLDAFGAAFPRPKAVVVFSAHWESRVQQVSEMDAYSMIYDFSGFPEALYRVVYPAVGDRALSRRIQERLTASGVAYAAETRRGLDHGVWTILRRLFPDADVPVIEMSVNPDLTPREQYAIGAALAPLRAEDVLVIGSGVTVHNFRLLRYQGDAQVQSALELFEDWLEEHLKAWDLSALFNYAEAAPNAQLAVPPQAREHFVPLFYAMGAAGPRPSVETLHRSWLMGVMTNTVFQFS
ncbi:MAG: dioxygenase [Alicyclobacillus sp.]|nr:dioxygenase [Alicyclobacillus sp.]